MAKRYERRMIRVQDEIRRLLDRTGLRDPYEAVRNAEHSYRRMRVRQVLFGMPDAKLRKRVISLVRELEALAPRVIEERSAATRRALQAAQRKVLTGSWSLGALVAGACVAIGHLVFALPGAIAGAVVGYFLGHGAMEVSKVKAVADVQRAKARLEEIERHRGALRPQKPELFSASEAESGEEDKGFFSEVITQKQRASAA